MPDSKAAKRRRNSAQGVAARRNPGKPAQMGTSPERAQEEPFEKLRILARFLRPFRDSIHSVRDPGFRFAHPGLNSCAASRLFALRIGVPLRPRHHVFTPTLMGAALLRVAAQPGQRRTGARISDA